MFYHAHLVSILLVINTFLAQNMDMKITFSFYLFLARKSSEKMKKHEEKFLKNVIIDAIITVFLAYFRHYNSVADTLRIYVKPYSLASS